MTKKRVYADIVVHMAVWCGETNPTLFQSSMGNKTLISYDECDDCNKWFSGLETDFSAFLGLLRTINQVKGRRGVPKVKSTKTGVVITGDELWYGEEVVHISLEQTKNSNVNIDLENGSVHITVYIDSFVPLNAFKMLVKLGLAVLPKEELHRYSMIKELLLSSEHDHLLTQSCCVSKASFLCGGGPPTPMMWIWKKMDPQTAHPSHEFLLFWQNFVFQYTILFHDSNLAQFGNKLC